MVTSSAQLRSLAGVLLLGSILWVVSAAAAQETTTPSSNPDARELLERLEKLEKRNEDLEKALGIHRAESQEPAPLDRDSVSKIVAEQLKADTQKKKQDEEDKRKQAEEEGFEVGKDLKMNAHWRDGLHFATADKAFDFTIGGRVDFDNAWFNSAPQLSNSIGQFNNYVDPNLGLTDGSAFRRARLRFQGRLWEVMEFNSEVDFAHVLDLRRRTLGIDPARASIGDFEPAPGVRITDAWMGFNELPWLGTFRAGHQKEWITFTNATSGRFLTFLERPLIFDAFNNDFQFSDGFTLQNTLFEEKRAYYWVGFFRNNSRTGAFSIGDGDYAYDARFTCLPVWNEASRQWLHLGVDYSYRNLHFNQTRFRARPLIFSGVAFQVPNLVNTGTLFSNDGQQVVTLEYASACGPLTLTGEYMCAFVDNVFTGGLPTGAGPLPAGVVSRSGYFAQGYYLETLYFLTGEHRGYRREQPSYDRIRPDENFFWVRSDHGNIFSRGAWEVGCRYDYLDLSDGGINGGILHAVTLGLNWHLNPNQKVQCNYVWMDRNFTPTDTTGRRQGDLHGLGLRFHWDF